MMQLNLSRRKFIKALFAIGATPTALSGFSAAEKVPESDEIWQSIKEEPVTFVVNKFGALDLPYSVSPANRWEAYDLWTDDEEGPLDFDLIPVLERCSAAVDAVASWKLENFPDLEGLNASDLEGELEEYAEYLDYEDWVDDIGDEVEATQFVERLSHDHYESLARYMKAWADSSDFGPEEEEQFDNPASGQDYVFQFFNMQDLSVAKALGVEIVEGDRPGSSYYAAELTISVEEANTRAAAEDIPILFKEE